MERVVGVTIEREKIRYVVLSKKKDRYLVEGYKNCNRSEEGVWLRVKEGLEVYRKVPIIVAIDGTNVFTRVFKLPSVGKTKLDKIIQYEAQQQLPLPLEEVVWSYDILRRVAGEENDVILVASREEFVSNFYNELESYGITPTSFTVSIVGLCELVSRICKGVKHSVMCVEIGYSTTNVVIIEGANKWVRSIPIGVENFLEGLKKELKISSERAVEILKLNQDILTLDPPLSDKGIIVPVMKVMNRLIGEIWRSIEVFSSSFNSLGVKKIYLTGELLNLIDLTPLFMKRFKVAVEKFSVDKIVDFSPEIVSVIAKERNVLPAPVGVAMSGFPDAIIHISLVPHRILKLKIRQKREKYLMLSTLFLVLTFVTFSVYNITMAKKYKKVVSEIIQANTKIAEYNSSTIRISRSMEQIVRKLEILKSIGEKRNIWLKLFSSLEEILPEGMWITSIYPYREEVPVKQRRKRSSIKEIEDEFWISDRMQIEGGIKGRYQILEVFKNRLAKLDFVVPNSAEIVFAGVPEDGIRSFKIEFRIRGR